LYAVEGASRHMKIVMMATGGVALFQRVHQGWDPYEYPDRGWYPYPYPEGCW
jgi:hypothetical protein